MEQFNYGQWGIITGKHAWLLNLLGLAGHRYLKQEIAATAVSPHAPPRFTSVCWHPEQPMHLILTTACMCIPPKLGLPTVSGSTHSLCVATVTQRIYAWECFTSQAKQPHDSGTVAVVDGCKHFKMIHENPYTYNGDHSVYTADAISNAECSSTDVLSSIVLIAFYPHIARKSEWVVANSYSRLSVSICGRHCHPLGAWPNRALGSPYALRVGLREGYGSCEAMGVSSARLPW